MHLPTMHTSSIFRLRPLKKWAGTKPTTCKQAYAVSLIWLGAAIRCGQMQLCNGAKIGATLCSCPGNHSELIRAFANWPDLRFFKFLCAYLWLRGTK